MLSFFVTRDEIEPDSTRRIDSSDDEIEVIETLGSKMARPIIPKRMQTAPGENSLSRAQDLFETNVSFFRNFGLSVAQVIAPEDVSFNEKQEIVDDAIAIVSNILSGANIDFGRLLSE